MAKYRRVPVIAYQFFKDMEEWPEGIELRGNDDVPSVSEWEDNRTYIYDGDYLRVNEDGSLRVSRKCDFEREFELIKE